MKLCALNNHKWEASTGFIREACACFIIAVLAFLTYQLPSTQNSPHLASNTESATIAADLLTFETDLTEDSDESDKTLASKTQGYIEKLSRTLINFVQCLPETRLPLWHRPREPPYFL
ncbi:hypothetical protein AFK76_10190 [Idiomarina zobellii]|jgi:hypothetical protein|uniref:Uncharacterized protein n=2 Tax=Idiomarina TaxID=135575 RepID=A0A837NFJ6_9GAMM|nr:hypothetical protein AFK76_10190 [Idiomarina zobellii]RUO66660.1 hypothetical protein CWI73_05090 [Idiomarina piscisalsi]SDG09538.1 hypothetical protein SAMN04515658_11245 [Idiomarina zobellii]